MLLLRYLLFEIFKFIIVLNSMLIKMCDDDISIYYEMKVCKFANSLCVCLYVQLELAIC